MFAVIEDTQKRLQSLYQVGDIVQGAIVREILPHQVIITVDGKSQRLEMKTEPLLSGERIQEIPPAADTENIVVEKSVISQSIADIDAVKTDIKFRPHYTDGDQTGLLLYGIRPQSVFDQMGFKNGDILRQVDDTPTLTEDLFTILFQSLENSASATRVTIMRRGTPKEFVFHIRDGSSSIQIQ
jgi:general secretion pathway protein C